MHEIRLADWASRAMSAAMMVATIAGCSGGDKAPTDPSSGGGALNLQGEWTTGPAATGNYYKIDFTQTGSQLTGTAVYVDAEGNTEVDQRATVTGKVEGQNVVLSGTLPNGQSVNFFGRRCTANWIRGWGFNSSINGIPTVQQDLAREGTSDQCTDAYPPLDGASTTQVLLVPASYHTFMFRDPADGSWGETEKLTIEVYGATPGYFPRNLAVSGGDNACGVACPKLFTELQITSDNTIDVTISADRHTSVGRHRVCYSVSAWELGKFPIPATFEIVVDVLEPGVPLPQPLVPDRRC
jgi:hypothetical protein